MAPAQSHPDDDVHAKCFCLADAARETSAPDASDHGMEAFLCTPGTCEELEIVRSTGVEDEDYFLFASGIDIVSFLQG